MPPLTGSLARISRSHRPATDEAWEGVVTAKTRDMYTRGRLRYFVTVRFPGGETRKIRIDKRLWNCLSEGNEIVKEAGSAPAKGNR
jgi:uncharacterized linocin/CFP29 family protein